MANLELKKGYKPISGKYGNYIFQVRNGKQYLYRYDLPKLPKRSSAEQKDKHKRLVVINECVARIQTKYYNLFEGIKWRETIYARVYKLYGFFSQNINAPSKLIKAILNEYDDKYPQLKI